MTVKQNAPPLQERCIETTPDPSVPAEEAVSKCIRCGRALKDPESIKNSRKFSLEQPPLPLK